MAEHNDFGQWGERIAAEFLEEKGYGIMRRNWRFGHRDIDIIAVDGGTLVIVEVKTRAGNTPVNPETAVDGRKMRSLAMAANAFVKKHGIDAPIRFDIIAITGKSGEEYQINHIEDAFTPLPY
ncbi:MAG: YraN family protein [Prevotella sp.]|nr:YraN family protein [Prevotella sp.]